MARGGLSGGGGSGGRSMGGGGGRSFGGRSGGGGHRGGMNTGGASRGGGFRPPPPPPPGGGYGYRPRPRMGGFIFGYGMGRMSGGGHGGGHAPHNHHGGVGCLVVPIVLILVVVTALLLFFAIPNSATVTPSTIRREALPAGSVNETEYYTDTLDWIGNSTTLTAGMKNFYKKTGVQPYLYLTGDIDGSHNPTEAQVEQFLYDTYDALFTDEAHLLLVFFEYNDRYRTWYLAGNQAKTVLDGEAMDILLDYIDKYYY